MARNFNELRRKMSPESQARAEAHANQMIVEMLLGEVRRLSGMTQNQAAAAMGIKQPSLSQLESQDDMQISTLRRIIKAYGGELEIAVKLSDRRIMLGQFGDSKFDDEPTTRR